MPSAVIEVELPNHNPPSCHDPQQREQSAEIYKLTGSPSL